MARASGADYLDRGGYRRVPGWSTYGAARALVAVNEAQLRQGAIGHLAEIGVHRGRYFIALLWLARAGEVVVGVDPLPDIGLPSGEARRLLLRNIRLHGPAGARFQILEERSEEMGAEHLRTAAGGSFRLLHVDGDHGEPFVRGDVRLASAVLAEDGVVVMDDVFNVRYPGVMSGLTSALRDDPTVDLVPFAIGENKLFLSRSACAEPYRAAFAASLPDAHVAPTAMFGVDVAFFAFERWEDLVPLSPRAWRRLRGVPPLPWIRNRVWRRRGLPGTPP